MMKQTHAHRTTGLRILTAGLAAGLLASAGHAQPPEAAPLAGWDRGFYLAAPDGQFRLTLGGWIHPRYAYQGQDGTEDTSSFTLRRVRLDFQGHVITPEVTFRVMSEHARTSNLRDAWLNYAHDPALQIRVGQFTVPFHWHRHIGPRRQHFAERGVHGETFGADTGRDLGLMAHGRLAGNRLAYGAGLFDGAGRNVDQSNSAGNMASARLTLAVLGALPREESDYADSSSPQLSLGGGVQGAWRNERRDWALGRSASGNNRADWITGALDARLAWQGFSIVTDGYLRHVDPDDSTIDSYQGWGGGASAGWFLTPGRCELVARWSHLRLDQDDRATRHEEWGAGLNLYHHGHDWKTRVNYLVNDPGAGPQDRLFLIEWHLQF